MPPSAPRKWEWWFFRPEMLYWHWKFGEPSRLNECPEPHNIKWIRCRFQKR
jgi:hypothetical protein